MRVKIVGTKEAEAIAWGSVKAFMVLLMIWLVLPPIAQGVAARASSRGSGNATTLPGRIRAAKILHVTVDFSARAVSVAVKAGDRVEAGQLLAVLESPEVSDRLENAQRRFQLAEQRLHAPNQGVSKLLWQEQHRNSLLRKQEAQTRIDEYSIAAAQSSVDRAEKELAAMTKMVQQRLATAQELESARRQFEIEQANFANAKNSLVRLKQELSAADSQLKMVLIQKDNSDSTVNPSARLDYEDARTAMEAAARQHAALRVVAPQAGTIVAMSVEAGAIAGGWAPLFQISDLNNLQVEVPVTARVAQMIRTGSRVRIVIPGDPPREMEAQVGDLQLVPDQLELSHVVRIPIASNGGSSILVGMECAVEFPHGGPA